MPKCIFDYNNLWADITKIITYSTQHPNFPATNSQHRDFTKPWKSRHGIGSGWGQFEVYMGLGSNRWIDFDEGGGELSASVVAGIYNANSLCTAIKTAMEAVGANTYTVTYDDLTKKFTIAGSGSFSLLWNTGSHPNNLGDDIGFDISADDTGASTYMADYICIHTQEYLGIDLGEAKDIYGTIIQKHNIQTSGLIQIWGSNNSDFSTGIKLSFTIQDDILVLLWPIPYQYRYWRFYIEDPTNPDGYVEMGFNFLGPEFRPTRYFSPERTGRPIDPSLVKKAEGGQVSTIQRAKYFERDYEFQSTNQKAEFETMFESVGTSKGFFFCENSDSPLTSTFYVQLIEWEWDHVAGDYWNLFMALEKLR